MKIQYKHQAFQREASLSVADAFLGQPRSDGASNFKLDRGRNAKIFDIEGFANNPVALSADSIVDNIRSIQMAKGLRPIEALEGDGLTLTVEMETGTGKTYTYIKTMYELNRRYGWSKFVIVVPSIAFREGSVKHIYFVAETKGNPIEASQLRGAEDAKIECARRHFAAISTGDVVFSVVKTYKDLYNAVMK